MVDPFERTAEPTVCTDRLSAKTENEITKLVLLERQADVHEIHVPAALGVSMFHCHPYRNGVGALPVQLALGRKIPQITIVAGVHTETSSGDFTLMTGNKQAARALPYEFDKEFGIRYEPSDFKRNTPSQDFKEIRKFLVCLGLCRLEAKPLGIGNMPGGLGREPFRRIHAVQGVVYLHPMHGKEAVAPELTITEHLAAKVAELYVQAQAKMQLLYELAQHKAENLLLVTFRVILPFAVNTALRKKIWWKQRAPAAQHHKHVGYKLVAVISYRHIRPLPWRCLYDAEQSIAMEKITALHTGQLPAIRYYDNPDFVHSAKIINLF